MCLLCKAIKEKKSSPELLEQSVTLPNAERNDSQQEFLAEISSLYHISRLTPIILQNCDSVGLLCAVTDLETHTKISPSIRNLYRFLCSTKIAGRQKEHYLIFSQVDSFTHEWCFPPKLISATSNHFTPGTAGPSFPSSSQLRGSTFSQE